MLNCFLLFSFLLFRGGAPQKKCNSLTKTYSFYSVPISYFRGGSVQKRRSTSITVAYSSPFFLLSFFFFLQFWGETPQKRLSSLTKTYSFYSVPISYIRGGTGQKRRSTYLTVFYSSLFWPFRGGTPQKRRSSLTKTYSFCSVPISYLWGGTGKKGVVHA